jgi:hypothetical protein
MGEREHHEADEMKSIPAARTVALALAALLLAFTTSARSSNMVVYRCLDGHLGVVYTDVPCKEGQGFEIRAGEADPAAVARLERLREALDQSAVQRLSDERRLAAQTVIAPMLYRESDETPGDGYGSYYTYPVAGYVATRPHSQHQRLRHDLRVRRGAPSPPYFIPRR